MIEKQFVGEFGIAESRYEAEFIDYLLDEDKEFYHQFILWE